MNRQTRTIDLREASLTIEHLGDELPKLLKNENLRITGKPEEVLQLSDLYSDDDFQKTLTTDRELKTTTLEIIRKLNDAF